MVSISESQIPLPLAAEDERFGVSAKSRQTGAQAHVSRGGGVPKGARLQCEICPNITDGCFDVCERSHQHN